MMPEQDYLFKNATKVVEEPLTNREKAFITAIRNR